MDIPFLTQIFAIFGQFDKVKLIDFIKKKEKIAVLQFFLFLIESISFTFLFETVR